VKKNLNDLYKNNKNKMLYNILQNISTICCSKSNKVANDRCFRFGDSAVKLSSNALPYACFKNEESSSFYP